MLTVTEVTFFFLEYEQRPQSPPPPHSRQKMPEQIQCVDPVCSQALHGSVFKKLKKVCSEQSAACSGGRKRRSEASIAYGKTPMLNMSLLHE